MNTLSLISGNDRVPANDTSPSEMDRGAMRDWIQMLRNRLGNFRANYAVELETARGRERLVKAIEKRSRPVIACPIEGVAQNITYS